MIYDAEGIDDSIKNQGHWAESNDTPTLTLFLENLENRSLRRVKQLGVTGVSMAGLDTGGLETWTDQSLKRHIDRASAAGRELRNVMFIPSSRGRFGEQVRDEDIEIINQGTTKLQAQTVSDALSHIHDCNDERNA